MDGLMTLGMAGTVNVRAVRHGEPALAFLAFAQAAVYPLLDGKKNSFLEPDEILRFRKLGSSYGKYAYLLSRYAVKLAMSVYAEALLAHRHPMDGFDSDHGLAPAVSSASTSDLAVALALRKNLQVAIDLEKLGRSSSRRFEDVLTPGERLLAEKIGPDEMKNRQVLWSLKTALSRAIGPQLRVADEILEIENAFRLKDGSLLCFFRHFRNCSGRSWELAGHVLAIVGQGDLDICIPREAFPGKEGGSPIPALWNRVRHGKALAQ